MPAGTQECYSLFEQEGYIINCHSDSATRLCDVHILLKEKCSREQLLYGLIQCYLLRKCLHDEGFIGSNAQRNISASLRLPLWQLNDDNASQKIQRLDLLRRSLQIMPGVKTAIPSNAVFTDQNVEGLLCIASLQRQLLAGPWGVDELLLEPRRARLDIQ